MLHSRRRSRSDVPKAWVRAGRILLLVNVVVLIASGFTEHLWTWDRFLHGGQDFELSLLALLAFFCLILVLAQHFRHRFSELLDRRGGSSLTLDFAVLAPAAPPSLPIVSSERPPGLRECASLGSVILRT
jgi:hypothetical protein